MSLIQLVKNYSERIKNGRNVYDIYNYLMEECQELQEELHTDDPEPDGVISKAIDIILCATDMIFIDNPNITEEEILAYSDKKCRKWEREYSEKHLNESNVIRSTLLEAGFDDVHCYRYNSASIRIQIVDSRFEGLTHFARSNMVESAISKLPSEIQKDIVQLFLLTPQQHLKETHLS